MRDLLLLVLCGLGCRPSHVTMATVPSAATTIQPAVTPVVEGRLMLAGGNKISIMPVMVGNQVAIVSADIGADNTQLFLPLRFPPSNQFTGPIDTTLSLGVDGLVGTPVLSHYDLEFNVPAWRFRMYAENKSAKVGHAPPWLPNGVKAADCTPGEADTLGGDAVHLNLKLRVNGHEMIGAFDSGEARTQMSLTAAKLLGIDTTSPNVHPGTGEGWDGGRGARWTADGVTLKLNGRPLAAAPILITNDGPDESRLWLGYDSFRGRVVFMSYSTGMTCVSAPIRP